DALDAAQDPVDRLHDVRIEMDRVDDLHVAAPRQFAEGGTDLLKPSAETLATVAGGQDQALAGDGTGQLCIEADAQAIAGLDASPHVEHGVDYGVSRDGDPILGHSFGQEIFTGRGGGGEVALSYDAGDAPVHFLGPRRIDVAR